jgi:HD-like signal output (HDOD) protein
MPTSLLIRPPSTSAQLAAARRVILQDLDQLDEYPMFSETTIWAMAMVNNPNISLAEVANLIRRDAVIASAVLRRANDTTYGSRRAIDSVQQAVVRVGLQECGKLLCTMGMRAVYNRHSEAVQERFD